MKVPGFLKCRRTVVSLFSIACLTYLGVDRNIDVSIAIAGIVAAVCGANSYETVGVAKAGGKRSGDGDKN